MRSAAESIKRQPNNNRCLVHDSVNRPAAALLSIPDGHRSASPPRKARICGTPGRNLALLRPIGEANEAGVTSRFLLFVPPESQIALTFNAARGSHRKAVQHHATLPLHPRAHLQRSLIRKADTTMKSKFFLSISAAVLLAGNAHAQYTGNNQTNTISGVAIDWMGNGAYIVGDTWVY